MNVVELFLKCPLSVCTWSSFSRLLPPGSGLELHLVYNPLGAFLPPPQEELEAKYRQELWDEFGIEFNRLFTMTNMPVKRFADFLYRR